MASDVQVKPNTASPGTALIKEGAVPSGGKTEDKKLVDFIVAEFQRYEKFWGDKFGQADKYYGYWQGNPPKRDYDWQNQVAVPVMVEAEQTITPRLFTALFPNDAPLDVIVEGAQDPKQGIKIKYLLQHYFRVSNAQGVWNQMLTQCTLFGTGYCEGGSWLVNRGWMIDENGNRYNTIIESRPDARFVSFYELYPHPAKLYMRDGLPIIRRRICDSEYLKSLSENPFFKFDNIDQALLSQIPESTGDLKKGEEYEILEYWGPWEQNFEKEGRTETKKGVPWWGIVINRKVLVRSIPNPYNHQSPPYIKIKLFPDAKPSWFGVGIGAIGAPMQERLNKLVNQRLDNVDLVLNRQGMYNGNDPLIDKKKLQVSKPGKFYKVSDTTTSIKWMDVPDVTASSYKEEELAKLDFRESTGATAPLMPGDIDEQHKTAMGINLLQGAAGMRFRPVLRQMEIDGIQELAMFYFSNLKQFMTSEEWILITGENGTTEPIQVTPEDIQAKVFFIPTGISETINKEVQVGQLLRFKEISVQDPTVNRVEINKRIAELMGFKSIEKLIVQQQTQPQGNLTPEQIDKVRQRKAEGATPQQIALEILGPPPQQPPPEMGQPGQAPPQAPPMMQPGG
jgi:hypothetical protein